MTTPKEIWLVDPAPKVIAKFQEAVQNLSEYMQSHGLECQPEEVYNLQGDEARAGFINCFKEVQRYRTQLDQYTDIDEQDKTKIEELFPEETFALVPWGIHRNSTRTTQTDRKG